MAIVLLLSCARMAWAFGPEEALAYKSPEYAAAEAKLSAQRAQVRALNLGISSTVSADQYQQGKEYQLDLTWNRSIVAVTQGKQAEEAAQRELTRLARESGRQALCAHAGLWEAQMQMKTADFRAQAAQLRCDESARKAELGVVSALDLESARLDLADATLAQRQAKLQLSSAVDEAQRFGLLGDADTKTVHFKVPAAPVDGLPDYRDARWETLVDNAKLTQDRRDNAPAFAVNALYQHLESSVEVDASTRGPNATVTGYYQPLNLILPYQYVQFLPSSGWQFIFKLEIPLNPIGRADIRLAHAELDAAKVRLTEIQKDLPIQLVQKRTEVDAATERLDIARERSELDVRRVASVLAQAKAGAASPLAVLEAQSTQSDNSVAYARAWKSYVTAVADYLAFVGRTWEVAP